MWKRVRKEGGGDVKNANGKKIFFSPHHLLYPLINSVSSKYGGQRMKFHTSAKDASHSEDCNYFVFKLPKNFSFPSPQLTLLPCITTSIRVTVTDFVWVGKCREGECRIIWFAQPHTLAVGIPITVRMVDALHTMCEEDGGLVWFVESEMVIGEFTKTLSLTLCRFTLQARGCPHNWVIGCNKHGNISRQRKRI